MAKGAMAKQNVAKKIAEAFGDKYIGEYNKKYYVLADDGGEQVQVAIALTWAKNPVEVVVGSADGGIHFDDNEPATLTQTTFEPAEITEEEKTNLQDLMKSLGL